MAQRHLALVVVGLDLEYFLRSDALDPANLPEQELRLAVTRDGAPNASQSWQRSRDLLRTFSLNELIDSAATVLGNLNDGSSDLVSGTTIPESGKWGGTGAAGSPAFFAAYELGMIRYSHEFVGVTQADPSVMMQLLSILELCRLQRTHVILIFNPMHADLLEIIDRAGLWPVLESWKREVTTLTAKYSGGAGAVLWDFSGYDHMSTESVSVPGRVSKWYREPTHYRQVLGTAILTRIFGKGDPHFGVVMTPENVESHLETIREQQRMYRQHQPEDVRRIGALYDTVLEDLLRSEH
jgi:hypothetical protein